MAKQKTSTATTSEIKATAKYVRISASKVRRIANLVRGKRVVEVKPILKNLPHKGARLLLKVINSAVANATNNNALNENDLLISTILINEGPKFKRFQPRARGRVFSIEKKTAHIHVGVAKKAEGK